MTKGKKSASPAKEVPFATEEEYRALIELVDSLVIDGDLSQQDVETITAAIDEQEKHGRLTDKQRASILRAAREGVKKYGTSEITKPMKAFAIFSLISAFLTLGLLALVVFYLTIEGTNLAGSYQGSTTELAFNAIEGVLFVVGAVIHLVLGIRLLKGKRYGAAQMAAVLVIFGVADMFLESLLGGISLNLLGVTLVTAFRIAMSVYLSPSLAQERKLTDNLRKADTKFRAETDTLGLDLDGKGYIKLDFFNIFWVFVVACFLGVIVEVIFHMVVVDPGVYQDRRGLLFGPFSPIYGVGAVLMTMALNRFKEGSLIVIFVLCTLIGGAFEYCVSLWMEIAYGVIAWDYSDQFLNVQGRTCLLFASMFGLLGLWWIKWALPKLLALINKIPWKIRYFTTAVCAVLMLFNIGMTLQALDCWQERVNGEPVVSDVQKFYAEHFDNDEMQSRFESMTMKPQK